MTSAEAYGGLYRELLAQYEPPALDAGVAQGLEEFVARRSRELEGVNLYE